MRGDPIRKVGWVAAILISIFVCDIGEFSDARAESKKPSKRTAAASALAPHWNHNGSLVSLVSDKSKQKFFYDTPRVGLLDAGVKPGTLLFEGQRTGLNFEGTAYQFYRTCKARGFPVTGSASDDRRQIILKGKAPVLDLNCNVTGSRDDTLIFTASQLAPNEPPKNAPVAAVTGATPSAPATNFPSEANKVEASKSTAAGAVASSAPPASTRTAETPAAEGNNAKATNTNTASAAVSVTAAVAPGEPPKDNSMDKQVAANPPPESKPAPPAELAKSETAKSEPAKDVKPPVAAQTAANTPAATNTAAPPPGEAPKSTQIATIPEATGSTAKTDEASKSKNATIAAVVVPPNIPADTSKPDASKSDSAKTPVLTENKARLTSAPEKMMEIVLKNGRILRIGRDIEPEILSRIILQLER